jgi:hypothetical protein
MNTNTEINPAGARFQRIQTVSRVVRYVVLGCLVLAIGNGLYNFGLWSSASMTLGFVWHSLMMLSFEIVLCLWYWKLAKLFQFYEHGKIFAPETIRCIKVLGLLCVLNWLLMSVYNTLFRLIPPPPSPALPPGTIVRSVTVVESSLHMGFFSFSYRGVNVGLLLAGIIIVVIAWIMDEGRKIQEEQELTV